MRKSRISNVESKVVRENYEPIPIYKSCVTSSIDTTFWIRRKISRSPIFTLNATMSILYQPQQGPQRQDPTIKTNLDSSTNPGGDNKHKMIDQCRREMLNKKAKSTKKATKGGILSIRSSCFMMTTIRKTHTCAHPCGPVQ